MPWTRPEASLRGHGPFRENLAKPAGFEPARPPEGPTVPMDRETALSAAQPRLRLASRVQSPRESHWQAWRLRASERPGRPLGFRGLSSREKSLPACREALEIEDIRTCR